jgi:hypothetical protein
LISAEGEITEKIGYHIYKTCFFKFVLGVWGDAARQPPPPFGCAPERNYWVHNVSRTSEGEGEFHIQVGSLKNDGQNFFKYFRMSI